MMTDIFLQKDVNTLLKDKHIIFMGDSNTRAIYKDIVFLSQRTAFVPAQALKTKCESSYMGDKLVNSGPKSNGRNYREERKAKSYGTTFSFFFLTRVYDDYVENVLKKISTDSKHPDILVLNSCLWDVSRWGPKGVSEYKVNMKSLMKRLQEILPQECLVIWLTAPPIAVEMKGGFLVKQLQFLKYSLRFHVMEANQYARKVVVAHGFDVLDVHYHLKMQLLRRAEDGIHWVPSAVRYVTNLLLTHVSLAWDSPLPHRYESVLIQRSLDAIEDQNAISDKTGHKNDEAIAVSNPKSVPEKADPQNMVAVTIPKNASEKTINAAKQESICTQKDNSKGKIQVNVSETQGRKILLRRNDKENLTTPKSSKKRRMKAAQRKKKIQQESHHGFMSRLQDEQRQKRIRQRQALLSVPSSYHSPVLPPQSPNMYSPHTSNFYNSNPYSPSPRAHCSRYVSSPNAGSPFLQRGVELSHSPARSVNSVSQPYNFPHVGVQETLQPNINFASSDSVPFGIYF